MRRRRLTNIQLDLVTNCADEQADLLEDLPVSLTYEIARPSAESTLVKSRSIQTVEHPIQHTVIVAGKITYRFPFSRDKCLPYGF